jgi:hydroxymethylglutaryl-CoA synthase
MAFVDDREDINSIALTAVAGLLEKYDIDPAQVGRLEIGTESFVDKSKSSKTELMRLFGNNRNIEGATVVNACYGGTAALFNSAAWVESSEWDGRYAIYVAADIAVYEAGPARPTGGVGAVAVLVGPDAPLSLVPQTRVTHAVNIYDFYKPSLASEYPAVDGKLSQVAYLQAVDDCYGHSLDKLAKAAHLSHPTMDSAFSAFLFHSPYNKLVQQSFRRMLWNDARRLAARGAPLPAIFAPLAPFISIPTSETYTNRDLDKALNSIGAEAYKAMVGPGEALSKNIGNSYTAALHANLLCLAATKGAALEGKRVGAFSYGSGALATMFSLEARRPTAGGFTLDRIAKCTHMAARLAARTEASPAEFTAALALREASYGKAGCKPVGSTDNLAEGTFYVKEVTTAGVRVYDRK